MEVWTNPARITARRTVILIRNTNGKRACPLIITLVRTVILYLLIILGVRLLGKRQVGELEPSELVLALLVADLASVPMQDNGIPLLSGVVPILVLLALSMILSVLTVKSIRFRAFICGRPSIIIENGTLSETELRRNRLSLDELTEALRLNGSPDISKIKYAILETSGRISVLPFAQDQPATVKDMGLSAKEPGLPVPIISDGRVIARNLKKMGYEEVWLEKQLSSHGAGSPSEVFLLTVDEQGTVFFAPREGGKG